MDIRNKMKLMLMFSHSSDRGKGDQLLKASRSSHSHLFVSHVQIPPSMMSLLPSPTNVAQDYHEKSSYSVSHASGRERERTKGNELSTLNIAMHTYNSVFFQILK